MSELPPDTKRRFIAGAICPRCKEMDTIMMFREAGIDHRECVSCDFEETSTFDQASPELPTRVNREPAKADPPAEDDVQVVRILDPKG